MAGPLSELRRVLADARAFVDGLPDHAPPDAARPLTETQEKAA